MDAVNQSPIIVTSAVERARRLLVVEDESLIALNMVEQLAELERRLDAGPGIAVPARRRADVDVAQREHVEPALRDAVRGGGVVSIPDLVPEGVHDVDGTLRTH